MISKFVLVFVTFPGTWQSGKEAHIKFDNMEQCEKALVNVHMPEAGGWKICTTEENEPPWYYPHLKPGYVEPKE